MQQLIIIPQHTVPEQTKSKDIDSFVFFPDKKEVVVNIIDRTVSDSLTLTPVTFSFSSIASQMTDPQKNVVKGFFKALAAYALDASTNDITGDIM